MKARLVAVPLAALAVAAAAVAVLVSREDRPGPPPPPVYAYGRLPEPNDVPRLSRQPTALPEVLHLPATVDPLSKRPVRRALALLHGGGLFVLGDDGAFRLLDGVGLQPAADAQGNEHPAVSPTTLSPDGRFAVFPQRDKVIVADLTRPAVRDVALAGPNEWVSWLGTMAVVAQQDVTHLVDPQAGTVLRAPFAGVAASDSGSSTDLIEARPDADSGGLTLRRWAGAQPQDVDLRQTSIDHWRRPLWRRGERLALMAFTANPDRVDNLVVLTVKAGSATVERRLSVDGPAQAMGWLGEDKVLVRYSVAAGDWLLAWDLRTDAVTRVSRIATNPELSLSGG
jgi:hypothetical protein